MVGDYCCKDLAKVCLNEVIEFNCKSKSDLPICQIDLRVGIKDELPNASGANLDKTSRYIVSTVASLIWRRPKGERYESKHFLQCGLKQKLE
jgi:hypothetical protein